ncbi:MAG TPA: ATP-binding protein, partial [Bryobacteraceae bacterium]|nr:ATP-binding protein [Bryobacteraceae bacterium]
MRSPSISLRLTGWVAATFLSGFVVFGTIMWFDLKIALLKGRDKTVFTRAKRLVDLLESSRQDSPARLNGKFEDFQEDTPEGNLIQVFNARGERMLPPAGATATEVAWPRVQAAEMQSFAIIEIGGQDFRVFERTVCIGGRKLRIFVAGQLEDNRHLLSRFTDGLLWTIPALLLLSMLAGYFVSRRALNPIDRFIASARLISIGSLSRRLPLPNARDEMARLAETCNDMLARLETAVGQITRFTADASHELRSPISFIRTVAEYALRSPNLNAESADAFRDIVSESELAARLLEDMLTLARADASTGETVFEPVDFSAAVQSATDRIRSLESRSHEFSIEIAREPLYVMGDRTSLARLAWILIDNAIKYTPTGGGRVAVSLTGTDHEANLEVTDNGVGIPAVALPRIFDRFFRVDPSRTQPEGSGLGLA